MKRLEGGAKRVVVAMSGGVDSSTVAGLLVEAGHEVIGVMMKLYDQSGADPNASDYDKRTALMLAAAEGERRICEVLLEAGADPAYKDRWGHTALDEATSHGHGGQLIELLKRN